MYILILIKNKTKNIINGQMIIYKTIIILVKTNMGKIYKFDIVEIFVLFIVCNCAYETDKHYTYDNFMINFGRNYTGPERDNH